jgi:hypothetical protein
VADIAALQAGFNTRFDAEQELFERLEKRPTLAKNERDSRKLRTGEREQLRLLRRIRTEGLQQVVDKRPKPESKEEAIDLATDFIELGPKAALSAGGQRGGDFLSNSIISQWAERVALSMKIGDLVLSPFGPTGAAIPGEAEHQRLVLTYREIHLLEGKRPDLLGFDTAILAAMSDPTRATVRDWPNRSLTPAEAVLVKQARCGIEVKNSTWYYKIRRDFFQRQHKPDEAPLSITVKDEEIKAIQDWSDQTGRPVIFLQVLFDEVYCMSFRRMLGVIKRGPKPGEYEKKKERGADNKFVHNFKLRGSEYLCAQVSKPTAKADVHEQPNGKVHFTVALAPASATDINPDVIRREIEFT